MNRTGTAIAGPNNDTLYVILVLDPRKEPVVIGYPAFDSKRVSLETSAYGSLHLPKKLVEPSLNQLEWQLLAQGRGVGSAPILQSARGAFGSVTCLARRMMKSSIFNLLAAPLLRIFHLSSRLKPTMSFGRLLSSLLRLDIRTHSLQALEYFFMLTLPFSYRNKVRAASFVWIDRAPAGASGGNFISLKKALDVVVATIAIALSAPLMLGVALAIKLESPGPIIFRRKRIGLNGSIFEIWKFRSMYAKHPDPDAAPQTSNDDPRVTRVGRVIRRSRIDDFPRLLNVIQGRMSVVGRRAHALDTWVEGRLLEVLVEGYAAATELSRGSLEGLRSTDCAANAIRLKS